PIPTLQRPTPFPLPNSKKHGTDMSDTEDVSMTGDNVALRLPAFNKNTPVFSGTALENVELFIRNLDLQFANKSWPLSKRTTSAMEMMDGAAQQWAFQVIDIRAAEYTTWTDFQEMLRARFQNPHL